MAPTKTPVASSSQNPVVSLWKAYNQQTPDRLKFIDAFLFFLMLSGIIQFAYCVLVTNYPYNAFLAGYGFRELQTLRLLILLLLVLEVLSANSSWRPRCAHKSTLRTKTNSRKSRPNGEYSSLALSQNSHRDYPVPSPTLHWARLCYISSCTTSSDKFQ